MTTATERSGSEKTATRHLMLIGGKAVEAPTAASSTIENPATRTVIGEVPRATDADVDTAVRAAAAAFEAWRLVRAARSRPAAAAKIADARRGRDRVDRAHGRARDRQRHPHAGAPRGRRAAVDVIRYFGGVAGEVKGETVPLGEHVLSYTRREPIGVVGGIVPWNAPVVLGTLKIAMAIAGGQHARAEGGRGRAARRCCASRRSATSICRPAC